MDTGWIRRDESRPHFRVELEAIPHDEEVVIARDFTAALGAWEALRVKFPDREVILRQGARIMRRLKAKARLAAGSARIARQRRDHLHKLSRSLVARYGAIAFEDLNMAGLKKGMLARSVHDAAWSLLVQFTTYKAASAGAEVKLVDPRGTSQTCPKCGTIKAKTLSVREHRCACGCILDRDVAAARVVHERAFGSGSGHGLRRTSQRVAA